MNCQNLIISSSSTIRDAIHKIDSGTKQIAVVAGENKKLLGVITDGDVRRSILQGISVDQPAHTIMNPNPVTALPSDSKEKILTIMRNEVLRQIPIVDNEGILIGLEFLDSLLKPQKLNNMVVLMAGGLGTRLRPLTNECPKPLVKIGNKPLLEIILENFVELGFYNFYFSVNFKAEMIENYFEDGTKWKVKINYIHEKKQLGTAGSLSLLPEKPDSPVIVMNGDLLTKINFKHLLENHESNQSKATMCVREYEFQVPYGVVKADKQKIVKIDEKPLHRFLVNAGVYVLDHQVFHLIPKDTYFEMTSLFDKLIEKKIQTIVYPIREYWLDVGRPADLIKANNEYNQMFI